MARRKHAAPGPISHYPTLGTVLMIEKTIKDIGPASLSKIHRSTEKQVMWNTLKTVVDYLEARNMIVVARNGQVVWTYDPAGVKRYMKKKDLWI
jgi:hypothetical protein